VRRQTLFAAGVSVALLLGAASPAFAKPAHPTKPAHPAHPAKPPKAHRVTGGGVTAGSAEFSVQAGAGKSKGHFNYSSATLKVRCQGVTVDPLSPTGQANVASTNCVSVAPDGARTAISFAATFFDKGKGVADAANITLGGVHDDGTLKSGSIHVR
jgi:hypothetical protein